MSVRYFFKLKINQLECHSSCLTCSDGTKQGCITCPSNSYFFNNECYRSSCPDKTYLNKDNICNRCEAPCDTCIGINQCLTCTISFFKTSSLNPPTYLDCVPAAACPEKTYPDSIEKICKVCHSSCSSCSGPTANDCLGCDYQAGYWKKSSGKTVGPCEKLACLDGMYIQIDYINKQAYCEKCYETCSKCDTSGPGGCLQCIKGRVEAKSEVTKRFE